MEKFFEEYKLNSMKTNHIFETSFDTFAIRSLELLSMESSTCLNTEEDSIIQESEKFIESVKLFFKRLIENAKKLIHDITLKFSIDIESHHVNKRLKELKKNLADDAYLYNKDERVKCFSLKDYVKSYTTYVNDMVSEYKTFFSKEYASVEEYEKASTELEERMNKKKEQLKLSEDEDYVISMNVLQVINHTENELNNMKSIVREHEKLWENSLKEIEKIAVSTDNATVVSDAKIVANEINSIMSYSAKKIIKSPIKKLSSIIRIFNKINDKSTDQYS